MADKESRNILFLCTGNSCRSQMAEGFARAIFPAEWNIYSAGVLAAGLNHTMVAVMKEAGIDTSGQYSKTIEKIPIDDIDYVVTLCGNARDLCPVFPRAVAKEHWPVDDPVHSIGTVAELDSFRRTRDNIKRRVEDLAKRLKG